MKKLLLIFLCSLLSLSLVAQEGKHYVIHSSGHVLGLGGDNRAVLVGAKSTDAKQLTFAKKSDGSFTIALNGRYLCLGPNSNWDTYFLDNASTPRAHYKVEPAGDYVKLRNVQTNAYLGTDGTAVGNYTFSDKNGSDPKHLWQLGSKPELTISVDTLSYPVSIDASRQLVEGWGVSLYWWASMCGKWSDAKIDQLLDWAVSPNGLNWNIFRYNIGGGDDPNWTNCSAHHMGSGKGLRAEMEGFQDERGGEYHWDRDAAQRKIMLKIREKRPDAIFEAFSNSCPWWMTVSGCCAGNANAGKDNLNPAYYQDFAHYLVDVCKHYRDEYGIEFKTLDPFNEPYTNYWGQAGGQEGCHFDYSSQIAFLKVLEPILKASGLKTVISAADETSISSAVTGLQEYQKAGVMGRIGQCNAHTYSADNRGRSRFGSLGRAAGKTVWMSETGASGQGLGGNLSMAQRLFDDVRYIAPSAWVDWQYVEEGNDQWCLVKGDFKAATMSRVKNYFVRQQVTRFIKPGYSIVASLCDQSLAAVNPACDSLVMVLLNTGTKVVHNVSLPMASIRANIRAWRTSETESLTAVAQGIKVLSDSLVQVVLPAQSITTLVVPITPQVQRQETLVEGDTYMIVPQSSAMVAVSTTAKGLCIADADATDPAQLWQVKKVSEGVYTLVNGKGQIPTTSTSYGISLSKTESKSKSQQFKIETIDGMNVRILLNGDSGKRGWDLSNEKLTAGTEVGAWEYGTSVAADHRNWFFVKVASASSGQTGIEQPTASAQQQDGVRSIYAPSGLQLRQMQRGINIVRDSDGRAKKILK